MGLDFDAGERLSTAFSPLNPNFHFLGSWYLEFSKFSKKSQKIISSIFRVLV